VPLLDRRDVTGVLWATRVAPFGPEEVNLLAAIANIAASSLHRMVLFEERGQRLRNLTALQAVSSAISSSLDMQHTLDGLLSRLVGHLGVDAADVLLFDPHTDTLKYVAGLGFESDADVGSPQRVGEGLGGRVAFEQLTLTYSDLGRAQPDVERAVRLARAGFRGYTGLPLVSRGSLKGVLEIFHRDPVPTDDGRLAMLDALSEQVAIAIENAQLFETVTESNANLARAYDATIEGWSRALEQRDSDTEGHTQRVTKLTLRLARVMGVPESDLVHVRRGALLHDIGKLGVPDGILWKNGPLTEEEWVAVRRHPGLAFDLLSPISFLQPALDIPYCHHEKWDGTGYPRKLKGDEIPLAARIFAVVDVFDALTSDRPYRSAWTPERALRHIENQAGSHFDPQVVDVFLEMLRKRN
jgi:GAF domain-containing protein